MIEYLGPGEVKIDELQKSSKFGERVASARVRQRADSIKRVGLLQRIVVRKRDLTLIAGEDRVAALTIAGQETARCEYYDCDDGEVAYLRRVENAERRHDTAERDKSLAEAHDWWTQHYLAEGEASTPAEAKRLADETIAAERGVKPGSVEKQRRRAKKREKERKMQEPQKGPVLPEGFETLGIEVSEEFAKTVMYLDDKLSAIDLALRQAQGHLTGIEQSDLPMLTARSQRLKEELHDMASLIRSSKPKSLCVFCKCVAMVSEQCTACHGAQFLTVEQMQGVDKRLLQMDDPWVVYQGKAALLSSLAQGAEPPVVEVDDALVAEDLDEDLF